MHSDSSVVDSHQIVQGNALVLFLRVTNNLEFGGSFFASGKDESGVDCASIKIKLYFLVSSNRGERDIECVIVQVVEMLKC